MIEEASKMSQLLESIRKEIDGVKMNSISIPIERINNAHIDGVENRDEGYEYYYDSNDERQSASFSVPSLRSVSADDQDHPSHQTNHCTSEIANKVEEYQDLNDNHATNSSQDDYHGSFALASSVSRVRSAQHDDQSTAEYKCTDRLDGRDSKVGNDVFHTYPSATSSFSSESENIDIHDIPTSELEDECSQSDHEQLVDLSPIPPSLITDSPSIKTAKTTVQNDESTMDHELIRAKAYTILLSTSNSVKINSLTTSFEEEGLFGLSFGILQDFTSKAIRAITGISRLKHHESGDASSHVIVFQFAIMANLMLRTLGIHQKSGAQKNH